MNTSKLLLITAMSIGLAACSEKKAERKAEPVSVSTETVTAAGNLQGRTYVGVVEEESATAVSFTGSGTLTRVYVNEGQPVKAGQLIAEIDKTQARNLVTAAEAQMRQANDALQRMKQLHDNGSLAIFAKFDAVVIRRNAILVAEEVVEAKQMESDMQQQLRARLRAEKKTEITQAIQQRRDKVKADFEAFKEKFKK